MHRNIAILYNQPNPFQNNNSGEAQAELGVLDEVDAVYQALNELNYTVTLVPLVPPLEKSWAEWDKLGIDTVFNLFEGFDGYPETEATVADILGKTGLPYTGCQSSALALCLDKARVKALLRTLRIATPSWQVLSPDTLHTFRLTYPCIVKPCGEDASHGLSQASVVMDNGTLQIQVQKISDLFDGKALVEEFIDGREFNVTVMGNNEVTVLPISEITYTLPPEVPRILTFSSKWDPASIYFQHTNVVCPAEIDSKLKKKIENIAISTFKLTGCRGYARLDIRLDSKGQPEVIEVNPNPDISPHAGAARQAKAAGMTYSQFIEKIVLLSLERI